MGNIEQEALVGNESTNEVLGDKIDDEDDSDEEDDEWEDVDEVKGDERGKVKKEYNTLSLKNFLRECDRFGISDRAAAKIGNGLLKDIQYVKKGHAAHLICPNKLRRERAKWGKRLDQAHTVVKLPQVCLI